MKITFEVFTKCRVRSKLIGLKFGKMRFIMSYNNFVYVKKSMITW